MQFFVHRISQASILEWVAIPFSRGSSWPSNRICVSYIGRQILYYKNSYHTKKIIQNMICCLSYNMHSKNTLDTKYINGFRMKDWINDKEKIWREFLKVPRSSLSPFKDGWWKTCWHCLLPGRKGYNISFSEEKGWMNHRCISAHLGFCGKLLSIFLKRRECN